MKPSAEFVRDWQASHGPVMDVALWLKRIGYDVKLNVPDLRPDAAERFRYSDTGDIEVLQRIEVKRRSIDFTSAGDYPFPTIFVDEVYKVDARLKGLLGFVIVNAAGTHAACVTPATKPRWTRETKFDLRQQRDCTWYCCPPELAFFGRIA